MRSSLCFCENCLQFSSYFSGDSRVTFAFLQFWNKGGTISKLNSRYLSIFQFAFKLSILKRSIDNFDIVKSVWILLISFDTAQVYSTLLYEIDGSVKRNPFKQKRLIAVMLFKMSPVPCTFASPSFQS